jgi:hypothetical protein
VMTRAARWSRRPGLAAGLVAGFLLVALAPDAQAAGPGAAAGAGWAGFGGNAQHTAVATHRTQPFHRIRWTAKVDLAPVVTGGELLVHYGSPMITAGNTVLVPTRVSAKAGFRVVAYSGASGARRWSLATGYRPPPFLARDRDFAPPLPAVLTPGRALAVAGAGGTILFRSNADSAKGAVHRAVFYGAGQWQAHRSVYAKRVHVSTPLTAGPDGSVYFGFTVGGATPAHLSSGIARIDAHGHGSWVAASATAGDPRVTGVAINCAPALSPDGRTLYTTVTGFKRASLVGLDAVTLQPRFRALLKDPLTGRAALILPSSSASPTVGPDGDVYYGIAENPFLTHDGRGWLLHYNANLTRARPPGSFGWDDTVSVLPARAVPGYHGSSSYLLVSKYNNYLGLRPHGDGRNKVAVLDPVASQKDPYSRVRVMKAVRTVLSPVHFPGKHAGARYEWCINSAAVDVASDSVIVNNEDGTLYRWDLARNTLAEKIRLNHPRPEAYTMTLIGPDGTVYAINNATLYAVGR